MSCQANRLLNILSDYQPHSSYDLVAQIYENIGPSTSRLAARAYDLKKEGHLIRSWKDPINKKMHWYQLQRQLEAVQTKPLPIRSFEIESPDEYVPWYDR